jgi:hypothetical protein
MEARFMKWRPLIVLMAAALPNQVRGFLSPS